MLGLQYKNFLKGEMSQNRYFQLLQVISFRFPLIFLAAAMTDVASPALRSLENQRETRF